MKSEGLFSTVPESGSGGSERAVDVCQGVVELDCVSGRGAWLGQKRKRNEK